MSKISVKTRVFALLTVVFLLIGAVFLLFRTATVAGMYEQYAAQRWNEKDYTQVSTFWLPGEGIDPDRVYSFRQAINAKLADESIPSNSDNSGTWYDAYSALTTVSAYTSRASTSLQAVVTGGNYFYLHPHPLVSGNYYTDGSLSVDYCVLDENAAWKLFGGLEVAGMEITIEDHAFVVSGVVQSYGNSVKQHTGDDLPTVYLLFGAPIFSSGKLTVDCYEAVLPDPIDDFGYDLISETVHGGFATVDNRSRYEFSSLWNTLKGLTDAPVLTEEQIYPFWENAARKAQTQAALLMFFELVFWILASVSLVVTALPFIKKLFEAWNRLKIKVRNKLDL